MTVTEFYDGLLKYINSHQEIPFDARVFVIRSIHNDAEAEYVKYKNALLAMKKADEQNTKGEEST